MCFVGSLWEVRDSRAAMLASTFYENIIEGVSVGEAMRAAREKVFNESKREGDVSWAAMILYGDPALSFSPVTLP